MSQQCAPTKHVFTGPSKEFTLQFNGGGDLAVSVTFVDPRAIFLDVVSLRTTLEKEDLGADLKEIAASYLKTLEGLCAEIQTIPHDTPSAKAKKTFSAKDAFEELKSWLDQFINDGVMNRIPYCEGEFKTILETVYKGFQLIAYAVHCLLALLATLMMQQKFDQEVLVPLASKKQFDIKELTALLLHATCITNEGLNNVNIFTQILLEGNSELGIIGAKGEKRTLSNYIESTRRWIKRHFESCPAELDGNFELMKALSRNFCDRINQAVTRQEELAGMISDYVHDASAGPAGDDNLKDNLKNDPLEGAGKDPENPAPRDESMNTGGSSKNAGSSVKVIWLD